MGLAKYWEDNEEVFWERITQKGDNEQTGTDHNSAVNNICKKESSFSGNFNGQSCFYVNLKGRNS